MGRLKAAGYCSTSDLRPSRRYSGLEWKHSAPKQSIRISAQTLTFPWWNRKQCLWWTIASSLSLQAKAPPRIEPPNPETRNPNRSQDNISTHTHVHFNIHLSQPPRQGATPHLAPEPQNPKPEIRQFPRAAKREPHLVFVWVFTSPRFPHTRTCSTRLHARTQGTCCTHLAHHVLQCGAGVRGNNMSDLGSRTRTCCTLHEKCALGPLATSSVSTGDLVFDRLNEWRRLPRPQAHCYELQRLAGSSRTRGHGSFQQLNKLMKPLKRLAFTWMSPGAIRKLKTGHF